MGYETYFSGEFAFATPLKDKHRAYLQALRETRRMKRDQMQAKKLPDPLRLDVDLPVGDEGEFFVGGGGLCGQTSDKSVLDYNRPPARQPSLWCCWTPNDDGTCLYVPDGGRYCGYVQWLDYLITSFVKPWDYKLDGEVFWRGEDSEDIGKIVVKDNVVQAFRGTIVYVPE